ncbi:MAG TPA: GntR family transcriptional regulator [Pseudonocardia sp.]|jgi:DNA-binding GntR family transcriptional regulator|uniref:GntR family transcriptional regulator n=1 Tax=Pseudonocardia sp. TaxID=60912 RepID=UPI002BEAC2F7|nr:GntR family transcriptional regulator [Pseudonocardia sp.]HTF48793.1 GntR family transcriptional regulator [Pseudonocardia sp.]
MSESINVAYVNPLTRREAVLNQLRQEIVRGVLPSGTLIKDAEVAARLGVSITPVREAIAHLAAEGLIDIAPNRTRHVTQVTQKNALELIDVLGVLACAGFGWGVDNLSESDLAQMRERLDELVSNLRAGNMTAAGGAGADFTTIVTLASGNRELQTHVDLVIARIKRLFARAKTDEAWQVWVNGYREILTHLEADDQAAAVARYRQIFIEYRAVIETMLFDGEANRR